MGLPKRRSSKSKIRMRVASHKTKIMATVPCPKCGQPRLSHRVCPHCGTYRGRQVLIISADE
ncbi:MAG: 50S ribosomal protein L32 [Verrucomicrobiota bacterium]